MERKIGVIDVGANTSRLIIMAYTPGAVFKLDDQIRERVRLSEGMGSANILQPEPMQRTIQLLKVYRLLCEANDIDTIIATATSPVRDARNRDEFLHAAQDKAGLTLRVLTGEEEAYYGYLGAINSMDMRDGLVLDIGGGSLELTRVRNRQMAQAASLPLGAVRLTEAFIHSDPARPNEVRGLTRHVDTLLKDLPWMRARRAGMLIGLGGTIRALAKIDQRQRGYPLDRLHGYTLTLRSIERILRDLERFSLNKRGRLPGLRSDRADVILAGTLALERVMRHAGFAELSVCGQGLREGLFYEHFLRESGAPLVLDVRAFGLANLTYLYNMNWTHARHVEKLAVSLFDQLRRLHGYGSFERSVLSNAALLHDIGVSIDFYNHHDHSAYLIRNAELPGFTHRQIALMAQIALYHRRGTPHEHPFTGLLTREDDDRIEKLSALLRLAEYLERSRTQVVQSIKCGIRDEAVTLTCVVRGDAATEMWSTDQNAGLFRRVFKRDVILKTRTASQGVPAGEPQSIQSAGPLWGRVQEIMSLKTRT